jgi:catechol 2,3-dioxygenase-like lactoylglutathione lyase family enzyme
MKIHRLDHVALRTTRLAEMVAFYQDLFGLKDGPRPDFDFPGAWIYVGDHPIIHLVEVKKERAAVEPKIEHFALRASGLKSFLEKLKTAGIDHTVDPVPGFPVVQVNLADVDGNHIHIDFASDELNTLD